MQKTKLGISVGLLAALLYFSGLFSGYIITIILAGYVLIAEENSWLKKQSVKAVVLMIGFSVLSAVVGIIPDIIGIIDNILNIFGGYFSLAFINNIFNFFYSVINFAEMILFLLLGLTALNQGTIKLPVIDTFIDKHIKE